MFERLKKNFKRSGELPGEAGYGARLVRSDIRSKKSQLNETRECNPPTRIISLIGTIYSPGRGKLVLGEMHFIAFAGRGFIHTC